MTIDLFFVAPQVLSHPKNHNFLQQLRINISWDYVIYDGSCSYSWANLFWFLGCCCVSRVLYISFTVCRTLRTFFEGPLSFLCGRIASEIFFFEATWLSHQTEFSSLQSHQLPHDFLCWLGKNGDIEVAVVHWIQAARESMQLSRRILLLVVPWHPWIFSCFRRRNAKDDKGSTMFYVGVETRYRLHDMTLQKCSD